MPTNPKVCNIGYFTVKEGMENTFLSTWENIVHESLKQYKTIGDVRLYQDPDNPRQYMSYSEWNSMDDIRAWMQESYFQDYVRRLNEICDHYDRHFYKLRMDVPYKMATKEEVKTRGR